MEKTRNPVLFSKSAAPAMGRPRTVPQRLRVTTPSREETAASEDAEVTNGRGAVGRTLLRPLLREWLLDLQVLGRSPRTMRWYEQKVQWYLENGGVQTLEELNGFELKRLLASLQTRGLAENTVRGMHLTFKAFGNWAAREAIQLTRRCSGSAHRRLLRPKWSPSARLNSKPSCARCAPAGPGWQCRFF